jgi:hypothetical protein
MKPFPVYRIDRSKAAKIRIGVLEERRKSDRGDNLAGLLKLAVGRFKSSPNEVIQIDFMGMVVEL